MAERVPTDTSNKQTVRPIVDGFIAYRPTSSLLSEDDAVNLAAWLIVMVPGGRRRVEAMLRELENT